MTPIKRARRRAADLHALRVRPAGAHWRLGRQCQGQAHAHLRCAAAVRSCRRQGDAAAAISAIDSELDQDSALVRFTFAGKVDVRTFREDNSYVVDVSAGGSQGRASGRHGALRRAGGLRPSSTERSKRSASGRAAADGAPPADDRRPRPRPQSAAASRASASAAGAAARNATRRSRPAGSPPRCRSPARCRTPALQRRSGAAPSRAAPDAGKLTPPAPSPNAVPPRRRQARAAGRAGRATTAATRSSSSSAQGDNLTLLFPFETPTPAAVFRRAIRSGWSSTPQAESRSRRSRPRSATVIKSVVAHAPARRRVGADQARAAATGQRRRATAPAWTVTLGNEVVEPTRPLAISRNIIGTVARERHRLPFDDPRDLHRLDDPDAGDTLLVVTALGACARLPQDPGLRRIPHARPSPRRGRPAARRRRQCRALRRQGHHQPSDRAHALRHREQRQRRDLSSPGARHAVLGLRPSGRIRRAQIRAHATPQRWRRIRSG